MEGFSRPDAKAVYRQGGRSRVPGSRASARQRGALGTASPGWGGASETLKKKLSPWKDRVAGRWQRRLVTTDSSAEQSLEVGCSVRFRRAQTPAHFGECGRSAKEPAASAVDPGWRPSGSQPVSLERPSGAEPAPFGGLIAPRGIGASALASAGQFHTAVTDASATAAKECSVTWGSASADRSITASKPLPRTPVPRPSG